eukprot:TRINITY_DN14177_c0_g1_i1.p2 TRINITY_DN14177_c0_g1~~TRINITY_DN14177_c0_g1_i1.p2  ORF type:complete len:106 (-),score=5.09 TRINITY_DN14177_c0_g1_i1:706-1023(-)
MCQDLAMAHHHRRYLDPGSSTSWIHRWFLENPMAPYLLLSRHDHYDHFTRDIGGVSLHGHQQWIRTPCAQQNLLRVSSGRLFGVATSKGPGFIQVGWDQELSHGY